MRKLLSAILIIGALNAATPDYIQAVERRSAEIPLQPAWPHVVNGSGVYASAEPTVKDHVEWAVLDGGADIFQLIGWDQAAVQMEHYLSNTGVALSIDPLQMMNALPTWRAQLEGEVFHMLEQAPAYVDSAGVVMQTDWLPARATRQESPDWYFAVGAFSYKLMLTVIPEAPSTLGSARVARVRLTIYVYDRYDWDDGRGTSIAGLFLTNELIGQLHRAGLARDYDVKGIAYLDFATVLRQDCDRCATSSY